MCVHVCVCADKNLRQKVYSYSSFSWLNLAEDRSAKNFLFRGIRQLFFTSLVQIQKHVRHLYALSFNYVCI